MGAGILLASPAVRSYRAGRPVRGRCGISGAGLPGREAERFGMGPAVVLGQDLAEVAGPVRDGAAADLAARDRQMMTVTGKRRECDLLISLL